MSIWVNSGWRSARRSSSLKAAANLVIAVQAGHHQELLEELGRLGQGVKIALLHPAGNQVVPGPFRGALGEDGGLHLDEALVVQEAADHLGHPVAEQDGLHGAGAPQIEIAVFEAQGFGDVHLEVLEFEGRGLGGIQDAEFRHDDLDFAGAQLGVHHVGGPQVHQAPHRQHEFIPQDAGLGVNVQVDFRVEHHLGDALPVPQIHKNQAPVVPAALHPAHEHHFQALVLGPQDPAGMGALEPCQ